jgi:hypothetical protein
MGMPVLIGAGVGALSSAAMGKSPLTGALLGGVTGGAFGGAEGFGSGFSQGGFLSSAAPSATGASVQLGSAAANTADDLALNAVDDVAFNQAVNTSLPTNVAGGNASINFKDFYAPTNFADDSLSFGKPLSSADQMFTNNLSSQFAATPNPLTIDPRRIAVNTPLTFGERLSDIGSSAFSYGKDNPMTLLGGANALSGLNTQTNQAQQQRLNEAVATGTQGITRPNFDPSSAIAAAPSYGLSRDEVSKGKMAQIASQARLNDEDERRIGQFYQSLIG